MATSEIPEKLHEFPPQTEDIFNDYRLDECLKSSSNCAVFVCHHISDSSLKFVTKIAIKSEASKLTNEFKYYRQLEGLNGIPQLIFYKRFVEKSWKESIQEWIEVDWTMIVIEKLCPKFAKTTRTVTKDKLSLEELVPMAVQQITLLEMIHNRGIVHKGVKPDNFVVSEDGSKVYIIDFNKSKRYIGPDANHIEFQTDGKTPKGLPLFHSLNYHNGVRCSRRDDMESLGFCWIYLLKGKLPWSGIKRKGKHWVTYVNDVGKCVAQTTPQELCEGLAGNASKYFVKYFEICRKLKFTEEPDYEEMRQLISSSLSDSNNNNQ